MIFWIVTALMALAVTALFVIALVRGRSEEEPAAAYDLRVYRDQLDGVDRDLARGVIAPAEAERLRTEISRRILAADAQLQRDTTRPGAPPAALWLGAALAALVLLGGSLALYSVLGAPGYGDFALQDRIEMAEALRRDRPDQAEAEARMPPAPPPALEDSYAQLLDKLRQTVAGRPDDLQGHQLLARHEAAAGNYRAAYQAQERVIALKGAQAQALDFAEQAELMIAAAGGYVSPQAEAALRQALERDPTLGPARYYWGLMMAQIGRPDLAFSIWEKTLRRGPADAPWLAPIRAQITDMAARAGVDYTPPALDDAPGAPALAGPSAEDMRAAAQMSDQDRQAMIRSMVEGLADRLATEGGTAAEWARLIGALGVLGETGRARAIRDEALQVFANDPAALDQIAAAGRRAGLGQ